MSYEGGEPRVYLLQIETGQRETRRQLPRHDLRAALLAGRAEGDHEPAARRRQFQRLRDGSEKPHDDAADQRSSSIDTSPSYSPDGSQVVFTSDRGGQPQIYVMGADGSNQTRISFGGGSYSTPVWSPRGDLDRLHQAVGRRVPDRRDEDGRLGRAHPVHRLPAGGPDLGAERPRTDVLPRGCRFRRTQALFDRPDRPQRAADPDAEFRVRPGLVAACSNRSNFNHRRRGHQRAAFVPYFRQGNADTVKHGMAARGRAKARKN